MRPSIHLRAPSSVNSTRRYRVTASGQASLGTMGVAIALIWGGEICPNNFDAAKTLPHHSVWGWEQGVPLPFKLVSGSYRVRTVTEKWAGRRWTVRSAATCTREPRHSLRQQRRARAAKSTSARPTDPACRHPNESGHDGREASRRVERAAVQWRDQQRPNAGRGCGSPAIPFVLAEVNWTSLVLGTRPSFPGLRPEAPKCRRKRGNSRQCRGANFRSWATAVARCRRAKPGRLSDALRLRLGAWRRGYVRR